MLDATSPVPDDSTGKTILQLTSEEAREFLLDSESYCNLDLPFYINFQNLLNSVDSVIQDQTLSSMMRCARKRHDVNYTILGNKDGKHAWRPFELIHPVLYVALVREITEKNHWDTIVDRFEILAANRQISCLSMPTVSGSSRTDKAEQVAAWWRGVEQQSIELSLEFQYMIETDITDCYRSIYTHSIAWALHTKETAKKERKCNELVGNTIDSTIQSMRNGQTNGIPQGSVLMDFIAEMVLGLGDEILSKKISKAEICEYRILRYRDDYRIFFNNPIDGENIMKLLGETTFELGLKLNEVKTKTTSDLVSSSIKSDKISWLRDSKFAGSLQHQLLIIRDHAIRFPNSGSLMSPLHEFHKSILDPNNVTERPVPLIAIVTDIAVRNPRTYSTCAAILSALLQLVDSTEEKKDIVNKIRTKFRSIPNTGLMEIWLQRVTYPFDRSIDFGESVCKLVGGEKLILWNSDWISDERLKLVLNADAIVNRQSLSELDAIIAPSEVELFVTYP